MSRSENARLFQQAAVSVKIMPNDHPQLHQCIANMEKYWPLLTKEEKAEFLPYVDFWWIPPEDRK